MTFFSTCRACGGEYSERFDQASYRYGICKNCGSISKILTQEEYKNLNISYDPGAFIDKIDDENWRDRLHIDDYKRHLAPLVARIQRKRPREKLRLLDIGCGMGGYLLAAKDLGLHAQGVEPSQSHSSLGRDRFNLDIKTAYFSKEDYAGETFDIIILWHVIEHIFEQRQFLQDVYSVLRPGGVILVATPNAASTVAKLTGRNWSMLRPVDHVGLLTPKAFPYISPPASTISITTGEYMWEPAISIAGAMRNRVERIGGGGAQGDSFRDTVSRVNDSTIIKAAAVVLSLPVYLYDRMSSRASGILCKIEKP
ncbi:class I SAM-dependent methyltransferase [Bradyrhizobium guangzhouense]|uniref:Class I SAM-dependent methyltransferase n=1 Tax=Bradyrhizobium guangzhouense TaxID=1325095 RepID=A0AAE5X4H7_9BRAD|nr:class I SAM-dependent methyltransferase [Bradyrhizobium guangzhouense]QAU48742.1 hypothetical protein XH91_27585 [Bradyrhizobium guangzhouense]